MTLRAMNGVEIEKSLGYKVRGRIDSNREGEKFFCHATFEGESSKWLVDTGSTYSVLNRETVVEMGLTGLVQHEDMEMTSYIGDKLDISGSIRGKLLWRNKSHRTKIIVTEQGRNLLGWRTATNWVL